MNHCTRCFHPMAGWMRRCPKCGHEFQSKPPQKTLRRVLRVFWPALLIVVLGLIFWRILPEGVQKAPPETFQPAMHSEEIATPDRKPLQSISTEEKSQKSQCAALESLTSDSPFEKSLEAHRHCIEEHPENELLRRNLIVLLANADKFLEAERELSRLEPGKASTVSLETSVRNRGASYWLAKDLPDSASAYLAPLETRDLLESESLWLLAETARRKGDRVAHSLWLDRLLLMDSTSAPALIRRGTLAYEDNQLDMAVSLLSKAAIQDPRNGGLKEWLSRLNREHRAEAGHSSQVSQRFEVRYDGREHFEAGSTLMSTLESAFARISTRLNYRPKDKITAIIYSPEQYRSLSGGPDWVEASYDGKLRLPASALGDGQKMEKVVAHELTHAFVREMTKGNIPCWLNEGLAQLQEGRNVAEEPMTTDAAKMETWPSLKDLEPPFTHIRDDRQAALYYWKSLAHVEYLVQNYGYYPLFQMLTDLGLDRDWERVMEDRFQLQAQALEERTRFYVDSRRPGP